ncbi:MAG: alpha/beta hydrolase [Chloroflexi bacterium]|nr:alpha/beta hydrolase [Chloroflexota bacterium]
MTIATPTDRNFTAGDLRLHFLDWGNNGAIPLVLLHHVSSNAHTWDFFARQISDRYRILALDLRGHGDSAWAGEGNYTTEHYASDVAALVEHLKLPQVIVLGGSLGGRVALVYAAQHLENTAALIMEDVGAVRPPSLSQGFADRVAVGDPQFATVEEWARQMQGANQRTPPHVFQHLALHSTKRLPNGLLGLKRDTAIQRDFVPLELWHYVEQVTSPFLLMLGSESAIVGEDQQARFQQLQPAMETVTVQGAGHHIVHDKPEEFEAIVLSFLKCHGL